MRLYVWWCNKQVILTMKSICSSSLHMFRVLGTQVSDCIATTMYITQNTCEFYKYVDNYRKFNLVVYTFTPKSFHLINQMFRIRIEHVIHVWLKSVHWFKRGHENLNVMLCKDDGYYMGNFTTCQFCSLSLLSLKQSKFINRKSRVPKQSDTK